MGSISNYITGEITLSSDNRTLTISGLDFVPNHIEVRTITDVSVAKGNYATIGANNSELVYVTTNDDGRVMNTYTGKVSFSTSVTITTKSAGGYSRYWQAGTHFYVAWREE